MYHHYPGFTMAFRRTVVGTFALVAPLSACSRVFNPAGAEFADGQELEKSGHFSEAITKYTELVDKWPESPEAQLAEPAIQAAVGGLVSAGHFNPAKSVLAINGTKWDHDPAEAMAKVLNPPTDPTGVEAQGAFEELKSATDEFARRDIEAKWLERYQGRVAKERDALTGSVLVLQMNAIPSE